MLSPDSPTVAVIIPVYNAVATLGRALDSVRAQTYPHVLETFVVDDGSEEGTEGLLRQHYPWVQYLRQEHSGVPGVARNRGVAASRADQRLRGPVAAVPQAGGATSGVVRGGRRQKSSSRNPTAASRSAASAKCIS